MRILFSLLALIGLATVAASQAPQPILKNSDKGFYIEHKVVAKDNFYSVGRLYNANAKDIAAFNKLDMDKGLNIGQAIKVPLTSANFSQTVDQGAPVYHKVGDKETLEKVSSASNNVSLDNLRRWNSLKTGNPAPGSRLIVGFLVSSQLPSITIVEDDGPGQIVKKEEIKEVPITVKPEIKTETPVKNEPVEIKEINKTNTTPIRNTNPGEGYFKATFEQQLKAHPVSKSETVTSGIFKTSSGWSDGKYYLLIDGVPAGTIIRVTNPGNNRSVYAKVLGEMSGIRQNEGLNIRMSNAAASILEVTEQDKFVVKISY